jgi:hypothetical protein
MYRAIIHGGSRKESFEQIGLALHHTQEGLSTLDLNEGSVATVLLIIILEIGQCNYSAVRNHLLGAVKMVEHIKSKTKGKTNVVFRYVLERLGFADALTGLMGYQLVIPDELLSPDHSWIRTIAQDDESARWISMDLKHVEFLRLIARYKLWATQQRKANEKEMEIVQWGQKIMDAVDLSRRQRIPPYIEISPWHKHQRTEQTRFLNYPQLQFQSFLHAEMHLLWCTMLLMTSFVAYKEPCLRAPGRSKAAIEFCQIIAFLGEDTQSAGTESQTYGQFFARLAFDHGPFSAGMTFGGVADLERQWAEGRYKLPFHSSTFEFHGFYASIRGHLEKEWNVGW